MTRRRLFIVLLCLPLLAYAERFSEHRFEAGLRAGLAGWNTPLNYVVSQPNVHGGVELAYSYQSPYYLCARVGVTADVHRAGWGKRNFVGSYPEPNQRMVIDYRIGSLRETYTAYSVGVPVQLGAKWKQFAFFIGPKIVIPILDSIAYKSTVRNAELSVYYPDYDNRVYESFPLAATRHFSMTEKGKCAYMEPYKPEWWLAMELSYTHYVKTSRHAHSFLVVGLYADLALTDRTIKQAKGDERSLITLSYIRKPFVPLERYFNTVLGSYQHGKPMVNDALHSQEPELHGLRLFDVGIKIAYAIAPFDPHKANPYKCNCL